MNAIRIRLVPADGRKCDGKTAMTIVMNIRVIHVLTITSRHVVYFICILAETSSHHTSSHSCDILSFLPTFESTIFSSYLSVFFSVELFSGELQNWYRFISPLLNVYSLLVHNSTFRFLHLSFAFNFSSSFAILN